MTESGLCFQTLFPDSVSGLCFRILFPDSVPDKRRAFRALHDSRCFVLPTLWGADGALARVAWAGFQRASRA
ncbi:MAG: hypothetical protein U1A78_24870 [Polyangia bacterium]